MNIEDLKQLLQDGKARVEILTLEDLDKLIDAAEDARAGSIDNDPRSVKNMPDFARICYIEGCSEPGTWTTEMHLYCTTCGGEAHYSTPHTLCDVHATQEQADTLMIDDRDMQSGHRLDKSKSGVRLLYVGER